MTVKSSTLNPHFEATASVSTRLYCWVTHLHTEDLVAHIVLANEISQKFLVHARLVNNLSPWVRASHLTQRVHGLNSQLYPRKCSQAR